MSIAGPTKQEIEAVFNRLRMQPANKSCFDCAAKTPTWSSVTYGIFICIDCSAVHRNLGVHLTFVRSTNLDTNWTWLQLRQMQLGGNANAAQFFRQHNCVTTDSQQKYNSRAAQLYRDKLASMAQQAMKVHGTKLHLDHTTDKAEGNDVNKTVTEEEDFFAQCSNDNNKDSFFNNNNSESNLSQKLDLKEPTATAAEKLSTTASGAPSIDLLNAAATTASKPTIGVRKIQPKKSGLGARKTGGLGATKVKTNFAEIEHRANLADQCKEANVVAEKPRTEEEELESAASMRLAYQDLSVQRTREEAKLKTIDPLKAKQMERLGMGFNLRGNDISHSAVSDMETIQQAAAPKTVTQPKLSGFESDSFFNDYSPSMYSGSGNSTATSSKLDKQELEILGFETIESHHSNISSMFSTPDNDVQLNMNKTTKPVIAGYDTSYSRKPHTRNKSTNDEDNAAQKKFGSAKGFGSDQFFGNDKVEADVSTNLSRFQGSNSISSSDYFSDGNNQLNRGSRGYNTGVNFQTPDLDDVKESVRQGVHKVADRLSSLAVNVMSSIQDKYGN